MSKQINRLDQGGRVDRSRAITFTFDGKSYQGYAGDTLASALLANDVKLVARSFKYHRPRGILSAGEEEPNALVHLREGARKEPNTRATQAELFEGLVATSQNRWPSLQFDFGSVNQLLSPFFVAGFYYKTFIGPGSRGTKAWMFYEKFIRKAAGLGEASRAPDPDHYDKRSGHCDVLIVGAGPSGIAAALAAGRSGARVILVEQDREVGGSLLSERLEINGRPAADWLSEALAELETMDNVTVMTRTTAFGYFDGNSIALAERLADHLLEPGPHQPRQRLWNLRAGRVVIAAGAIERPIVFADNDRPGVMLAGALREYINRYAVVPGKRALLFTYHDEGYRTAYDLRDAGAQVVAIIDPREESDAASQAKLDGFDVKSGHVVHRALGGKAVTGAEIGTLGGGDGRPVVCDLIAVSGGWTPTLHLHSQAGGKTLWNETLGTFVPGEAVRPEVCVGAAKGQLLLSDCLGSGFEAGSRAAQDCGFTAEIAKAPVCGEEALAAPQGPSAIPKHKGGKRFVDFQHDVTAEDIELAEREAYRSAEHAKRYTTLGMATDQGKTANVNGLAILADIHGKPVPEVGHTTFRPPYTPVAMGTLTGREEGRHFMPIRRSPMHDWHVAQGAEMVEAGLWMRPRYFPQGKETMMEAQNREAKLARTAVAICDVSTLGKIDIQGPDAAEFLNRVYTNGFAKLPINKARYGLMLREDGFIFDDGTTSRLGENHFLMTTTTANAGGVMTHLEYYLDAIWPDLKVHVSSVTDQWAAMALAGPKSRETLQAAVEDCDVSNEGLAFMGVCDAKIAGYPVKIYRISFSGELAYEVATPADYGLAVWEALIAVGEPHGIAPYGMEALDVLRQEKGHVTGRELDGRTTPDDLGLGKMVSSKKVAVGQRLLNREALLDEKRWKLVGLKSLDNKPIRAGSLLVEDPNAEKPLHKQGYVTSSTWSENLQCYIALALLERGRERYGERVIASYPLKDYHVSVEICSNHMFDPKGERLYA